MAGKYSAYPEYKDSGVEWLGEVPYHWHIKKLKYICKVQTGDKDTVMAVDDGDYPFFVRSQTVERINTIGADCEAVLTAGDGVGVGKVFHYYDGKFDYHQRVYMLNNFSNVLGRFVFYYLSNNFYKVALEGNAKSTVDSLRLPQFLNFEFSLPELDVQQQIANFLDYETAKIDTLIDKQQQLIKLLKEKRQAIISHAVTKGLNPNAPMRDSAIEWLGKVPAHWKVLKLQRVLQDIEQGSSPVASNNSPGALEAGVLKISAVKSGRFHEAEAKTLDEKDYDSRFKIHRKDLLVTRGNTPELVADACVVEVEPASRLMLSDLIYRLNTRPVIKENYLCYWLLSTSGRLQIQNDARGSSMTMAKVSQGHIKSWLTALPPLEEQVQIIENIEYVENKLRCLLSKCQLMIRSLKERRTAIISAAVTGKIDVRNWVAPAHPCARDMSASMHDTTPEPSRNKTNTKETVA